MLKRFCGPLIALLLTALPLLAQGDDEVLFTVDDRPVTVGEFRYIYTKTNGEDADFSRASVMEYLDLYERFKLKVARARDMGLDTVVALQNELEGYRQQLADNYLIDRAVTDRLVRDLYERQQQDVDFSHILLRIPSEADTQAVYERAQQLKAQLTADNFAERAGTLSEDTYSKTQGGRIGFVSAPLPRGMHRLESALWDAPEGAVMGPVRTAAGYHLFVKHATRPAYGQVEIAHILVRKPAEGGGAAGEDQARESAAAAAAALAEGQSFEEVAATYSEDDKTRGQGGYIGFFGINRYNKEFERAAFALEEDGQVSDIVESPVGFHILKRVSRRGVQPFEQQRPLLEAGIKQDTRYAEAQQALLEGLREQYGTEVMEDNVNSYLSTLDSSFFSPRQSFTAPEPELPLLKIGDRTVTAADFSDYLTRNGRQRALIRERESAPAAGRQVFDGFVLEQVQAYAEAELETEFPEFRALMREYREGILLFEATKLEVWDRAGTDTTGLEQFFAEHRDDYRFAPRARVRYYRIRPNDSLSVADVIAYAGDRSAEETMAYFGRQDVAVEEEHYEEDRLPEGLTMKAGSQTKLETDASGVVKFYRVEGIEPARAKELQEARGYVIADYQDQLEREWVDQLREEYAVRVNKKALDKLIRD